MSSVNENITTWPGWKIYRLLGEGSYGKVYEIHRIEDNNIFRAALKVIQIPKNADEVNRLIEEGMNDEDIYSYFECRVADIKAEYTLMAKLRSCPNIVIYDDHMVIHNPGAIGWTILIKMELLIPFRQYVAKHGLSETLVIKTGIEICKALEACHAQNIIHRDIKPGNMFINEYENIKLGDFSIAVHIDDSPKPLERIGTYPYMAPEVYYGNPIDYTLDIYSLGMVLYRMMNHNLGPFENTLKTAKSVQENQARRFRGEPLPYPKNGSMQLKNIVMRALQFDPAQRFQSAIEMRKALESIAASSEIFTEKGTSFSITEENSTLIPLVSQCGSPISSGLNYFSDYNTGINQDTEVHQNSLFQENDTYTVFLQPTFEEAPVVPISPDFQHIEQLPPPAECSIQHEVRQSSYRRYRKRKKKKGGQYKTFVIEVIGIVTILFLLALKLRLAPLPIPALPIPAVSPKRILAIVLLIPLSSALVIHLLQPKKSAVSSSKDLQEYDVFISFKHSASGSDFETPDCKMAEELYKALTIANFKVFFSKITLPEKGRSDFKTELENALKNSSVLIAVATSIDNLNSEWVSWETHSFYNYLTSRKHTYRAQEMYCYLSRNVNKSDLPDIFANRTCFQDQTDAVTQIANRLKKPLHALTGKELLEYNIERVWDKIRPGIKLSNGRYNLAKQLKKRKYYSLFAAFDDKLKRDCIIKIINRYAIPENVVDPEVELLKELDSCISGIPFVYDFDDSSPDMSYSVMTFVPGRSLEEIHKSGQTIIEKDIILWTIRLSEIIDQLHNSNEAVVHCNVKPSNIFLGPNQKVSLINYSCAYRLQGKTELNKYRAHSTKCAAPELLKSGSPIDGRADIYSIGYVMLYMLIGKKPLSNNRVINPEKYGVSPELSSVICKCMALRPEDRYTDCSSLIDDLHKIQYRQYTVLKDMPQRIDLSFVNVHSNDSISDRNRDVFR